MEKPRILSGHALVAKGVTKIDATLPELGLKNIIPNGSWLEQKQIQSALEARKHLIEVERIEKFGTLSHAIWRDDWKLAEVTQKTGGQWQYLGHNIGKTLYLRPEETLFLIEANCLLLKHNDLTVSLQKAYSLLLKEITITQYRVYASLSRLGYKILRHRGPKVIIEQTCSSSEKKSFLSDQLVFDSVNVQNVMDQPSDSANSILDSIRNEETSSNLTNENTLLCPDSKSSTEINKITKTNSAETEIHKFEILDGKSVQLDATKIDIAQTTELNYHQNNDNNKQNVETPMKVTANTETNIVMEVNIPNVKMECSKLSNTGKIKTENRSDTTIDILSTGDETNKVDTDGLNNIANNTQENKMLDVSHENSEPTNITTEFETSDNNNESTKGNATDIDGTLTIEVGSANSDPVMDLDTPKSQDFTYTNHNPAQEINKMDCDTSEIVVTRRQHGFLNYVTELLNKLSNQQIKPSNRETISKHFENIPDMFKKEVFTINAPNPDYIPKNIFVNNTSYLLNIKQIKNRCPRSLSVVSPICNSANHIRRRISNSNAEYNQNLQFVNTVRFPPRQTLYFRPCNLWRPQNNLNYVSFNMFFQRCFPNMYFSRFQSPARPLLRPISYPNNFNTNDNPLNIHLNNRKRLRNSQATHLRRIKNLAVRLKQLIMSGNTHIQNIESLHKLLFAFNNRYKSRLRLNKNFEIVNDENIVETIELDTDDDSKTKRPRLSQDDCDKFNENLNTLRQLALKLKDLVTKNKSTPKHKRALSKAIKTFNKSYDADIYMNKNYEIIDNRFITIDSDSETDCVVNEPKVPQEPVHKSKKLRNPFYILKQCSNKQIEVTPSTSKENYIDELHLQDNIDCMSNNKNRGNITNIFSENWLPNETDFGRAEVTKIKYMRSHINNIKNEYLYSFINNHYEDFNNWLEAKIAFLQQLVESNAGLQTANDDMLSGKEITNDSGLKPLIHAEECLDTSTILEKLKIIKNNKSIASETCLNIHFDVYNRDVRNFRKTNPPQPHFRIICMEKSSNFPSAAEIMALNSKYEDNVPIVFAVAGLSSISYLQINPIDLPVYTSNSELG